MASKRNRVFVIAGGLLVVAVYATNSSRFAKSIRAQPLLLAHRGVHQDFPHAGVTADTCTAARINPPHNGFIENTIPSMKEAFHDGADIVEFDIQHTRDGKWAVFHDWTLDCRTNGHGVTHDQTLAYLQTLDVGYGYTADAGKTFPFRGKGVGLLPSLDEVLNAFPKNRLLIQIKSDKSRDGTALVRKLKTLPRARLRELMVFGGSRPVGLIRREFPGLQTNSPETEKSCLIRYLALGWLGYVPRDCRNSLLIVPVNITPWLWGWPNRFLRRMHNAGTGVFVADRIKPGGLKGLNTMNDLSKLPPGYTGGIWTDRIGALGPALGRRK
jgi:glycerophosphoryl diester phosphodiesterase